MKIKIDFITASLTGGGAERVLILLANEVVKKSDKVSILTFGGTDSYEYDKNINRIKLHGGNIKNHTLRRFSQLYKYYKKKENRPDVIISFLPSVSFVAILIARIFKIKIIVSEHINHLQIGPLRDQFTRKYLYRLANFTTVLTKFDIDYYQKYNANVVVMPNPCTFSALADNNHAKENSIIAVGNLDRYHHKGFDNLITIVTPILKKHPTWDLKIVGEGETGMNHLLQLAIKSNIENRISFLGFRSDVKDILKNSEIFILSSRFEGLPMVLMEAMSQGMACIAYNCKTGPSDILTHRENGLLIDDQNIVEMQESLELLITDRDLRKNLSNNAISSLERFSMKTIITKWEELFDKIFK
tara:strand:- start:6450 stop:7523 length:1074 start_codon:yes stop_codon:yes gene_type:complete